MHGRRLSTSQDRSRRLLARMSPKKEMQRKKSEKQNEESWNLLHQTQQRMKSLTLVLSKTFMSLRPLYRSLPGGTVCILTSTAVLGISDPTLSIWLRFCCRLFRNDMEVKCCWITLCLFTPVGSWCLLIISSKAKPSFFVLFCQNMCLNGSFNFRKAPRHRLRLLLLINRSKTE